MTAEPSNKQVGTTGEMIAAKELERQGLRIVRRNFRCPFGEMDIIAEETTPDGIVLAFVEVKTRRGTAHGTPKESVNARKQAKLYQIAQAFFAERAAGGEEPACRFDIMEVFWQPNGFAKATFHRAAFMSE